MATIKRWVRKYTITEEGMKFLKDNGLIDENGKWTKKWDELTSESILTKLENG